MLSSYGQMAALPISPPSQTKRSPFWALHFSCSFSDDIRSKINRISIGV